METLNGFSSRIPLKTDVFSFGELLNILSEQNITEVENCIIPIFLFIIYINMYQTDNTQLLSIIMVTVITIQLA